MLVQQCEKPDVHFLAASAALATRSGSAHLNGGGVDVIIDWVMVEISSEPYQEGHFLGWCKLLTISEHARDTPRPSWRSAIGHDQESDSLL